MNCELRIEYDKESGKWIILATPGTERGIEGSVLWEGVDPPTKIEQRMIFNAVNYGVRLAVRGASIYVDSVVKTAEGSNGPG